MIFTIKHDEQCKDRFVAGEQLTQPAIESLYSGAVSIHSNCLRLLIVALNDLTIYQADVSIH